MRSPHHRVHVQASLHTPPLLQGSTAVLQCWMCRRCCATIVTPEPGAGEWCGHSGLARTSAPPRYLGLLSQDAAWSWLCWRQVGVQLVWSPPSTPQVSTVSWVTVWAAWPGLVCGVRSVLTWAYQNMGTFTIRFLFLYFISTVSEMANKVDSGIKDADIGHVNVAVLRVWSVGVPSTQHHDPGMTECWCWCGE